MAPTTTQALVISISLGLVIGALAGESKSQCSQQSVLLARQTLVHELQLMNNFNSIWFGDSTEQELLEDQKRSISQIIMSGLSRELLNADGQAIFELAASYIRPVDVTQMPTATARHLSSQITPSGSSAATTTTNAINQSSPSYTTMKLMPQQAYQDSCSFDTESGKFSYTFGLLIGPVEHNLDVVYNLPRDLQLIQPLDWKYAQIRLVAPRLMYHITLEQSAMYKLADDMCPLEVADVIHLSSLAGPSTGDDKPQVAIYGSGLAPTNQTVALLERVFQDYTKPTISSRLRQELKFYLNAKSLPLSHE